MIVLKYILIDEMKNENIDGFMNECISMHKLNHRNVLNLIGVCAGKEDIGGPLIVIPYMKNRDLKSYLCSKRKQCAIDKDEDCTVSYRRRLENFM